MKLKPLSNHVVVQRSKVKRSKGGILLPDTAQEKPKEGKVVAVGPGKLNEEGEFESMSVKSGDEVLFPTYGGVQISESEMGQGDDMDLIIIREDEILAIIEK